MARVLITGTSKGIGFEAALAFARVGHKVFATMRKPSQSPLKDTAANEGLPITVSTMDVDCDTSVGEGIAAVLRTGPIDVLINNAGIEAIGSVEETPLAVFRSIMETNYFGALRCIQAVLPHMRERRNGCIVNISSVAGRFSLPPMSPYCASKWALEALTEALAGEMKTFNVRVASVQPGIIDTAMARRIEQQAKRSQYGQGERIANMFAGSLANPVPPSLVADKILNIVESGTWELRHPVGPDAQALLSWRSKMSDEAWVELNGGDDGTFFARVAEMG